ncbi:MAG: DinB family protein [Gillisia sp.]
MKIQEFLLPELHQEVALTETFLKRIPQDKLDWRPHQKSMTMGELANHLAELPSWVTATMELDELEMNEYKPQVFKKVNEIVEALKNNANEAEASLQKPDEEYFKNWKMLYNGEILMEKNKLETLRSVVMNQFPHHRAQLGVYFRLLDVPVPATYGPSADEQ